MALYYVKIVIVPISKMEKQEESSSGQEILKDTHFVGKEGEHVLNNLVDIEIESGNVPEYLMNLDKVYHGDDIMMFILFVVFIIVNGVVGYLSPPSEVVFNKSSPVIPADNGSFSTYTIGLQSLTSRNSHILIRARYTAKEKDIQKTLLVNTTMSYEGARSDHTKHSFSSVNITFSIKKEENESKWETLYLERIVDFDQTVAEIVVSGNETGFSAFDIEARIGSQSDAYIQIMIRVIYSVVLCIVYHLFQTKMKSVEVRHEQSLTIILLFTTCFLNNPTLFINYIKPNLFVIIFDDIMKAFYCGFLTFFIFIVLGHCGDKEKIQGEFVNNMMSIAWFVGMVMFSRELMTDLAQIYNPMMTIERVDRWLCGTEWTLIAFCFSALIYQAYKAKTRIDESEHFRYVFYIVCTVIYCLILMSLERLVLSYSTIKFLVTFGTTNAFAMAMAYAHYPFSTTANLQYKDAKDVEIGEMSEDGQLMDQQGHLLPHEIPPEIDVSSDNGLIGSDTDEEKEEEKKPKSKPKPKSISESDDDNDEEEEEEEKKPKKKSKKSKKHVETESDESSTTDDSDATDDDDEEEEEESSKKSKKSKK